MVREGFEKVPVTNRGCRLGMEFGVQGLTNGQETTPVVGQE